MSAFASRRIFLTMLALGVLACAERRSPQPGAGPRVAPSPPPAPTAAAPAAAGATGLYDRLAALAVAYGEGLELLATGEETEAEAKIGPAAEGLRAVAAECGRTPGCDAGRFFDTLHDLLDRHQRALKQQAARVAELESAAEAVAAETEEEKREPGTSPFVVAVPELGKTMSLLRGTDLAELITLNDPIRTALNDWLTWMRPMLVDSWDNYQYLRARIAPIYEQAGLPEALLFALMATETGVKVHSVSRAGAAGPLQFMPTTGRRYGLTRSDGFDLRLDPESATRASVGYLNDQLAVLNEDLEKALAAYNGGETRMSRLQHRHGDASLWSPEVYGSLPRETREYVPRVLAAAWLFLHPDDYGLKFDGSSAETARLAVREPISIDELTVCLGGEGNPEGWFRTLRNLNPRLQPSERVPAGGELEVPVGLLSLYETRCLDGELLARARELHQASDQARQQAQSEFTIHVVRRGETLARIAARYGCAGPRELAEINGIAPPRYVIRAGQRLRVPRCG